MVRVLPSPFSPFCLAPIPHVPRLLLAVKREFNVTTTATPRTKSIKMSLYFTNDSCVLETEYETEREIRNRF